MTGGALVNLPVERGQTTTGTRAAARSRKLPMKVVMWFL